MADPLEQPQHHAEQHRRRVTVIATLAALVLIAIMVWVVLAIVEQQRTERCLASRRPDCFAIPSAPREGPVKLDRGE